MKTGLSLSGFVCLIILMLIAVGCLLGAFRVFRVDTALQYLADIEPEADQPSLAGSVRLGILGGALGILAVVGLFTSFRGPTRKGQISFVGGGGEVTVATIGLEDFIRRAASSIHGVQEAKARVRQKGNDLAIETTVVLGIARPVMEITGEIQNRIRVEIEQRLGLPKVEKIKVHVSRMMPELERSTESSHYSADQE